MKKNQQRKKKLIGEEKTLKIENLTEKQEKRERELKYCSDMIKKKKIFKEEDR